MGTQDGGVHDGLDAGAFVEAWDAGSLTADGVDELPGLVVAEGDEGIAGLRIAGAAGPAPVGFGHVDPLEAGSAAASGLEVVPVAGDEKEGPFAAVELDGVEAAPAFIAAAGEFAAFEDAGGAVGELGDEGNPIVEVTGVTLAQGMDVDEVGDEPPDGADEVKGEIDAVAEHVAELAGAGEALDLAPSEGSCAPVLEAAGAVMIGLAQVAAGHEVAEVAHGGDEPVGEGGHVPDLGAVGGVGHGAGVGGVERQGLFAEDMFAAGDGGVGDGGVGMVGGGDDDGVDVVPSDDVAVIRGDPWRRALLPRSVEDRGVGVAECRHPGIRA